MHAIKQSLFVASHNFLRWHRNPRILVVFGLNAVLCFLLSNKVVQFASEFQTPMQILEPFVWTFGDGVSILLSSLLLVLLFIDMPFITAATPFYLIRITRKVWLLGQIIYISLATSIYLLFTLLATAIMCAPNSFSGNVWSKMAAILGYSDAGNAVALPASVKAMESYLPYSVATYVLVSMVLYTLLLVGIMLMANLLGGKFWGIVTVFLFSLYGLLLNPDFFGNLLQLPESLWYRVNVTVGWVSPLNHATFHMHNFGYDLLPRLWMSWALFIVSIATCFLFSLRSIRKYNFNFSGD
jgi:hypothetical protein